MVQPSPTTGRTTVWPIDIYCQPAPLEWGPRWRWGWRCNAHDDPIVSFGYLTPASAITDMSEHVGECRGR